MRSSPTLGLVTLLLLPAAPPPARADELAEKGRAVFQQHQRAVVTVQVVMKTRMSVGGMGGQENESKYDLAGTVVDPSGLTVVSFTATDPTSLWQRYLESADSEETRFKFDTKLTDVKILLDDGTELPARVVLRDRDLDLAFLQPKTKPAAPLPAVDLTRAGAADVLDQVITLNRLGEAAGRAHAASIERISAVVRKPRLFYVPDSTMTTTTLGSPAFLPDGRLLGIFVMRSVPTAGGESAPFGLMAGGQTSIIVPAADVLKVARQALEAGAEDSAK